MPSNKQELANEGVTFKPSVNPKSLRLALEAEAKEGLAGVSDVGERLYKRHEVKQQRKSVPGALCRGFMPSSCMIATCGPCALL